jgi:hypothetical protein
MQELYLYWESDGNAFLKSFIHYHRAYFFHASRFHGRKNVTFAENRVCTVTCSLTDRELSVTLQANRLPMISYPRATSQEYTDIIKRNQKPSLI